MRLFRILILVLFIILYANCTRQSEKNLGDSVQNRKFKIQNFDNFTLIHIRDAWQNASDANFKYILSESLSNVPDSLNGYKFIKTPVRRVIVFSTTHVGFLLEIEEGNSIIAASGRNYIYDEGLKNKVKKNEIKEIGFAPGINYESIIELKPDVIFIYGLESSVTGIVSRLESVGIQSVIIGDYLENHPLGKMEWIKVFSAFYNKEKLADSIFNMASEKYHDLCSLVTEKVESRPTVMLGLPWKDSWNMAGGRSFTAKLIHDAGGNYLWSDNNSEEFLPLAIESVIQTSLNSDCWLNTGSARSLNDIIQRDKRYKAFNAWKTHSMYNNDKQFNGEANNFWEKGVVEPHIILRDMIKIFHPEIIPDKELVYYRKLE
ncbi:MAG: ABC transporter substrate-binding protein [Bacteroidales bacterium]|nr:ABC transporter substrate-binding protein [Bacteroidales bacterium]